MREKDTLIFGAETISIEKFIALCNHADNKDVTSIEIKSDAGISDISADILAELIKLTSIIDVKIPPLKLKSDSISALFAWIERNKCLQKILNKQSTELNLSKWPLSLQDLKIILYFIEDHKITSLTLLNFSDCGLTIDKKLALILEKIIKLNPGLTLFDMANNKHTSEAETILKEALNSYVNIKIYLKSHLDQKQIQHRNALQNRWDDFLKIETRSTYSSMPRRVRNIALTGKQNWDERDCSRLQLGPQVYQGDIKYWIHSEDGSEIVTRQVSLVINASMDREETSFKKTNFYCADISSSEANRVSFTAACLRQIKAQNVKWFKVDLSGSDIFGGDFSSSKLRKVILACADARTADFENTSLNDSDFREINLSYANLKGAKLCRADLRLAILYGADVTDTNFTGANLAGADLRETIGLTWNALSDANLENAFLPKHLLESKRPMTVNQFLSSLFFSAPKNKNAVSLLIIKPDGIEYFTQIVAALSKNKLKIIAIKSAMLFGREAMSLYDADKNKYFFNGLLTAMTTSLSILIAIEGNPTKLAEQKTYLRSFFYEKIKAKASKELKTNNEGDELQYINTFNIFHASDPGHGEREIVIFFGKNELKLSEMTGIEKAEIIANKIHKAKPKSVRAIPVDDGVRKPYLIMIKPIGIKYVGIILEKFSSVDINIIALKSLLPSKSTIEKLYRKYSKEYFYEALVEYIAERKIIVLAVSGLHSTIMKARKELGDLLKPMIAENDLDELDAYLEKAKIHPSKFAHKRAEYQQEYSLTFDFIHCSDPGEGEKELNLFFEPRELNLPLQSEKDRIEILKNILANKSIELKNS
jgi:uncharacterized protein YjbI with pentapeptide repeats/nucleoside diphosphate kinase